MGKGQSEGEHAQMNDDKRELSLTEMLSVLEEARVRTAAHRLAIAEIIGKRLEEIHSQGYLYLSLIPENVRLVRRGREKGAGPDRYDVVLVNTENAVPVSEADSMAGVPLYEEYSAPECVGRTLLRMRTKIGVFSDYYMLGKLLLFMFIDVYGGNDTDQAEGNHHHGEENKPFGGNGVLQSLLFIFTEDCTREDPSRRYASDDAVLHGLALLRKADALFMEGDYLGVTDVSFACHLTQEQSVLVPSKFNADGFHGSVQRLLNERLLVQNVDRYHTYHSFAILWGMARTFDEEIPDEDRVLLMMSGMRCYNNLGDSLAVCELGRKVNRLAKDPAWLLDANLLLAVAKTDTGDYTEALQLADGNIRALGKQRELAEKLPEEQRERRFQDILMKEGRSYSSRACSLSRLGMKGTMEAFELSLGSFGALTDDKDREDNLGITRSHILHYACECHDRKLYEQYAALYFDGVTLAERTDLLLSELKKNFSEKRSRWNTYFKLYVFVKGIEVFYLKMDDIRGICRKFRTLQQLPFEKSDRGYPLSLIFFHLGMIERKLAGGRVSQTANYYFRTALSCDVDTIDTPFNIQMVILGRIRWIYNEVLHQEDRNAELLDSMLYRLHEAGWRTMERKLKETGNLQDLLCFEEA